MKKVLVGGCFNAIHSGHEYFLKQAKALGDFLIVVLTNDLNNKKPYAIPAAQRKHALEKLGLADKIIIGEAEDFSAVVRKEKPAIIALGYDQQLLGSTEKAALEMKIHVLRIGKHGDFSTGKMMAKNSI